MKTWELNMVEVEEKRKGETSNAWAIKLRGIPVEMSPKRVVPHGVIQGRKKIKGESPINRATSQGGEKEVVDGPARVAV